MRLRAVLIVLLAEYLVIAAAAVGGYLAHSLVPQSFIDQLKSSVKKALTSPLSIFLHNLRIMTGMWLPFVGPVVAAVSMTATGFLLGVFVAYEAAGAWGYLALALAYAISFFMPHGLLELSAYALAIAGSLELTRSILSRRASRAVWAWLASYAAALALLLAAAYAEWYEIQILA